MKNLLIALFFGFFLTSTAFAKGDKSNNMDVFKHESARTYVNMHVYEQIDECSYTIVSLDVDESMSKSVNPYENYSNYHKSARVYLYFFNFCEEVGHEMSGFVDYNEADINYINDEKSVSVRLKLVLSDDLGDTSEVSFDILLERNYEGYQGENINRSKVVGPEKYQSKGDGKDTWQDATVTGVINVDGIDIDMESTSGQIGESDYSNVSKQQNGGGAKG